MRLQRTGAVTMLRQLGAEAVSTDLVFFYRQSAPDEA